MSEQTVADKIWNRACEGSGDSPYAGDRALAALLLFHGLAMNGGVLHAVESLSQGQLTAAQDGYRCFGFESGAVLIGEVENAIQVEHDLDSLEAVFDQKYWAQIPDDDVLVKSLEGHQSRNPKEYTSLVS